MSWYEVEEVLLSRVTNIVAGFEVKYLKSQLIYDFVFKFSPDHSLTKIVSYISAILRQRRLFGKTIVNSSIKSDDDVSSWQDATAITV